LLKWRNKVSHEIQLNEIHNGLRQSINYSSVNMLQKDNDKYNAALKLILEGKKQFGEDYKRGTINGLYLALKGTAFPVCDDISSQELAAMKGIDINHKVFIIDVRSEKEFRTCSIPESITFREFELKSKTAFDTKNFGFVGIFVSTLGVRSGKIMKELLDELQTKPEFGVMQKFYNLRGGILDWISNDYPVISTTRTNPKEIAFEAEDLQKLLPEEWTSSKD